ncbi:MAG: hypothetical protein KKB65_07345 [Nanoarchaeota archaeon]|nr:hypothetical protein [Nanoarchaeota archaeon]MBU1031022.1 hypothetical protein [Nanoarchaeota archaeon]MBU1849469.1 hypothetical protein [Nanoarchaeota archaeon]
MSHKEKLIGLIGQNEYDKLYNLIPDRIKQDIIINFSDYLIGKSEQEILDFYSDLINNNQQWTIPKISGSIMILTSHLHDLLIRLVQIKETDQIIINKVSNFDLHYLIMYCTGKYKIPNDYFIQMMELKHFRNMMAHDFNSVMETSFNQAIHPIAKGHLLIIVLIQMIKEGQK